MHHLKQRSTYMAASAVVVLAIGAFSLPMSRADAGSEPRRAPSASVSQFVDVVHELAGQVAAVATVTTTTTSTSTSTTTSTTTTLPPPPPPTVPPTTAAPAPQPVVTAPSGACGGDLPTCCIMMRESHGNPTVVNPSSGASGKWQFMYATWNHYMGYETAAQAPEWVQDQKARELWAGGAGASHWAGNGC